MFDALMIFQSGIEETKREVTFCDERRGQMESQKLKLTDSVRRYNYTIEGVHPHKVSACNYTSKSWTRTPIVNY